jgi:hypothetical protein
VAAFHTEEQRSGKEKMAVAALLVEMHAESLH